MYLYFMFMYIALYISLSMSVGLRYIKQIVLLLMLSPFSPTRFDQTKYCKKNTVFNCTCVDIFNIINTFNLL